jgi:tetratricopeptide (TPR) repeat protein
MKGRTLAVILTFLLVVAALGQALRWRDRMAASRLLGRVEALTVAAVRAGRAPVKLMADNLEALQKAESMNPVEVGIPTARGTQYLFLLRPETAIQSYQEALALEPQSTGYFALGRAQWIAGQREEARGNFAIALRLAPKLARDLPPGAQ